jgi:hypothetical protein
MKRYKVYDIPHKALRNALSQLSLLNGSTDFSNHQQVEKLHQLGTEVFGMLTAHAADENRVTLAELEQRSPGASTHDTQDHERLEAQQHNLEKLLDKIHADSKAGKDVSADAHEFHLAYNEFNGTYLSHTAEEERVTQNLLWKHFTDEELFGHRNKIMAGLKPETMLTFFKYVLPAQTHNERAGLFKGFRQMAPEPFFKQGLAVAEKHLQHHDYKQLTEAIG